MIQIVLLVVVCNLLFNIKKTLGEKNVHSSAHSSVVMDTSALIDGRVVDVVRAGFLPGTIIVAKRVLDELQLLADGRNTHKRSRARYGLDVVSRLQEITGSNIVIDDFKVGITEITTDESLLKLAKLRGAMLCTTDFNLNKVARAEDVTVLNVNELAKALRPEFLPGELVHVKILQRGESKGQGVGYLDDGTMVVVDNSASMQHKTITASIDRMIQTDAGKMAFATYKK